MSAPGHPRPAPTAPPTAPREEGITGPLVLITLGVLLLGTQLGWAYSFWDLWPVLLIVIGIGKMISAIRWNRNLSA